MTATLFCVVGGFAFLNELLIRSMARNARISHIRIVRALILDDEPIACNTLSGMLAHYPQIEVIGFALTGREGIEAIRTHSPDLVFMDIEMPDMSGFSVLEALSDEDPPFIIFVTAHHQYALKAFEIHALDFLSKPLCEDRLRICIQRALKQIENQKREKFAQKVLSILRDSAVLETRKSNFPRRISIKTGSRIEFVEVDAIDWIEAADQYAKLHSAGKSHLLRMTMSQAEERFDPGNFFRVHRCAIVNVKCVREVVIKGHGDCVAVLENGTRVKVSRFRKNQFLELLGKIAPPKDAVHAAR